ncbi:lysophospholipid acyltransferase family protein [Prosthecochloris sp. HL-130-GSB]|jgi:chlorobactene lauroyltransferase|uniref:lysophospholipid acyltransferase family protein n=1 Tax=Prosthecochloris sp. HL-130-GSB TaxID=1974213 RepID=UPI000A1C0532|nr:lysophospholipid acyltransferase family protein [Prosthecochloris sp. HL-130-GSB]ARM30746.1 glycerol acyltransferase [Prosthecochloris sp. HL-130-GSB]MBO8093541.1 lysophospholipid acyltransferase family protein [Prosthecochloris sp.]
MLTVRRSTLYTRWFGWYSRRQFRKHFHSLRVSVEPDVLEMDVKVPVIFYGNHAYWWDGFWSQLCSETYFRQNLYIIIEDRQLRKHRFFTRLGAFSIDRSNPRNALRTLEYAAERLSERDSSQNALWMFPQGKIEHVDTRPLRFFRGVADIAKRTLDNVTGVYLVSVVSRIEYLEEQKPELFLSFRSPQFLTSLGTAERSLLTETLQNRAEEHLDAVKKDIMNRQLEKFHVLLEGSSSVNRRVERIRSMLGLDRND